MTATKRKSGARPPVGIPTPREIERQQNEALWLLNSKQTHTYYGVRVDDLETPRVIDGRYVVAALNVFGRFLEEPILNWAADVIVAHGLTNGTKTAVAKRVWAEANQREFAACYHVDREIAGSNSKISRRLACERVTARLGLPGGSLASARAALERWYREYIEHGLDPMNHFSARTGKRLCLRPIDSTNKFNLPIGGIVVDDDRDWRRAAFGSGEVLCRVMPAETVENHSRNPTETEEPKQA